MKRTPDKIKDFVEARPYDPVENYSLDLPRSLAAYRFTEVTSDLLANWLDALANLPRNCGAARALAGLRGVGKSHTLACFAALCAIPELRTKVSDPHVGTSARRLLSRRYTIVRVERGTRPTIQHELKAAFAEAIGGGESDWPDNPAALLAVAASRVGDSLVVVIIDTAIGRESRVMRNDGPVLTALAQATQAVGVFLGLALDDDIEGADGANVGLSASYQIDYLELEHLYRIVDTHLFHKNARARAALHDMYLTLRTAVPGFNWSEPRFSAVYPVHPLVGDVSAVVRLYAPSFAFLPFVASAVARATNRPAFSLITLDEIFDRCDFEFRKAENLREAFSIYDSLAAEAINKFPIMQRLQAKLVLKALFILSLDGRGATARDIGAAMLMYDEQSPETAIKIIDEMLARFASEAPAGMLTRVETPEGDRFCLTISASAGFEAALNGRISESAQIDVSLLRILKQAGRVRFEDWPFQDESLSVDIAVDTGIIWRGTPRYGRLILGKSDTTGSGSPVNAEWTVVMRDPSLTDSGGDPGVSPGEAGTNGHDVLWLPASLRTDEVENLKRLAALRGDVDLFSRFGETARASERMYASLVERSFGRVFIEDGKVVIKGTALPVSKEAQSAKNLSDLLAATLAPMLGARYSKHPIFAEVLTEKDVSELVASFFGGAGSSEPHIQHLAELFVVPLGLAVFRADHYTLEAGDGILKQPWVREVITLADSADGEAVPIQEVYSRLRAEPFGLLRESQHLVLAALVAHRRINLITANGDRITRRTLGQRLKWDDVFGVARAENILHTSEELTAWAKALTGDNSLAGIVEPTAREAVRKALSGWLGAWRAGNPLHNFSNLPDEALTIRVWNLASTIRKSFGAAGEAIEDALSDEISLEEGLQRVCDSFNDSHDYFKSCSEHLSELSTYTLAIKNCESIRAYLASAEATDIEEIESIRRELIGLASNVHNLFDSESNKRFEMLWIEFQRRHVDLVAGEHERAVGPNAGRSPIDEVMLSDDWRDFELLSRLTIVNSSYWAEALSLIENGKLMRCDLPVRRILETRARCSCGFKLSAARNASESARSLITVVRRGLEAHFRTLMAWRAKLREVLSSLAEVETNDRRKAQKAKLAERLAEDDCRLELTAAELDLLEEALQSGSLPPLRVEVPSDISGLLTREELRGRLRQWVDDLPNHPALVDVVSRN